MAFENGNKADGKHYWRTPPDLMKKLQDEFYFDLSEKRVKQYKSQLRIEGW